MSGWLASLALIGGLIGFFAVLSALAGLGLLVLNWLLRRDLSSRR